VEWWSADSADSADNPGPKGLGNLAQASSLALVLFLTHQV